MREHNFSSISNTSIHEAYPGHHLQLAVANRHPSLTRLATDAPEFVEGWGMYSEQMMREQGFDDAPNFRLAMYTDAIWRACRIILDVRMHRGEIERRRGDRLPRREHQLRGRERPGRGPPLHLHADLPAVLPARQGAAAPAPRRRAAPARAALRPARVPRHAARTTARCRSASTAACCARRSPPPTGLPDLGPRRRRPR